MTDWSPVTLTYDGVDLQDWANGIHLDIVSGLHDTPAVRGDDTTIPQAAGSLEGTRVNDYLPLELRGSVRCADGASDPEAGYHANMRTIRTLFASNRPRADLVATLPDGTVLTISARPLNLVPAVQVPDLWADVSISLRGDGDWVAS